MHSDSFIPPDDPTLVRLELLGNIAKACRLALAEFESADSVVLNVEASMDGVTIDCQLMVNGHPIGGWGC